MHSIDNILHMQKCKMQKNVTSVFLSITNVHTIFIQQNQLMDLIGSAGPFYRKQRSVHKTWTKWGKMSGFCAHSLKLASTFLLASCH